MAENASGKGYPGVITLLLEVVMLRDTEENSTKRLQKKAH